MIFFVANDQNRKCTGRYGFDGRDFGSRKGCELSSTIDHKPGAGSEKSFAKPGILAQAGIVIGGFLKIGEGSFRNDGFNARISSGGLQCDPCAHGFAQSKEVLRFLQDFQGVNNCAGVLSFKPAVGGDFAAAFAVATSVHHDDAIAILEEKFGLAEDANAIIGNAVK